MPNDTEDVRQSGKTGSERRALKVTRLTRRRRLDSPLLRWLIGKRTAPAYHELLWV